MRAAAICTSRLAASTESNPSNSCGGVDSCTSQERACAFGDWRVDHLPIDGDSAFPTFYGRVDRFDNAPSVLDLAF